MTLENQKLAFYKDPGFPDFRLSLDVEMNRL